MFDFLEPTNIGPRKDDDELSVIAAQAATVKAPKAFDNSNIASTTGLPEGLVAELNSDQKDEIRTQQMIHDIPENSALRSYVDNPAAMAMASQDIPTLTKLENAVKSVREWGTSQVAALMNLPEALTLGWERDVETTRSGRQAFREMQAEPKAPLRPAAEIQKDMDDLEAEMAMSSVGTDFATPDDSRDFGAYERQRIMLERELAEAKVQQGLIPDEEEIPNILTREIREIRLEREAEKRKAKNQSLNDAVKALGYDENILTAAAVSTGGLAGQTYNRITEGTTGEAVAYGAVAGLAVALGMKAIPAYAAAKGITFGFMGAGITLPAWLAPVGTGAAVGYRIGSSYDTFETEGGSIYAELRQLRDVAGRPLPDEMVRKAAILTGTLTSFVEATLGYTGARLLAQLTPAKAFAAQQAKNAVMDGAKRVLLSETGRQAMTQVLKNYTLGAVAEVTEEVIQEGINVFVTEMTKDEATQKAINAFIDTKGAGEYYGLFTNEAKERYAEVAKSMFLGSMGLGFPSMAISVARARGTAHRANAYLNHLKEAHATMQSTNMAQQSQTEAAKVAKHIGYNQEAFISADDIREISQTNPDLLKKLGVSTDDIETALRDSRPTSVNEADVITKLTQEEFDLISRKLVMEDAGISAEKAANITDSKVLDNAKSLLNEMRSEQNIFKTAFEKLTGKIESIAKSKGWTPEYSVDVMQSVEAFAYRNAIIEGQNIGDFISRLDIEDATNTIEQNAKGKRVSGRMTPADNKYLIQIFKDADMSTLLHELGHVFLSEMNYLNRDNKGSKRLQNDLKALTRWFESHAKENTRGMDTDIFNQEVFARGFELYLRSGRAPSQELIKTFNNYRTWLTAVYKHVEDVTTAAGFKINMNEKVREVFDRMLATDAQIDAAAMEYDLALTPQMIRELNLTAAEQEQLRNTLNAARKNAKTQMQFEKQQWALMRERLWKRQADIIISENKIYADRDSLVEQPIDKVMLDNLIGKERAAEFAKTRIGMVKKDTKNDPEFVAVNLGYRSVDEMVTAFINTPTKKQFIDDYVTDQREKWEASNFSAEETLFAQQKLDEYMESVGRIISRQTGMVKDVRTARLLKQKAERAIGATIVSEAVGADKYLREYKNALKRHQQLIRSTKDNKFVDALGELERAREMLAMSKAARAAAKSVESKERITKKYIKSKSKPQLDFNRKLINTLNLMGLTDKRTTEGADILDVVKRMGIEIEVPPVVSDDVMAKMDGTESYRKRLTVDEADQVFTYTKWLHDFGIKIQEGRLATQDKTVDEFVAELIPSILSLPEKGVPAPEGSFRRRFAAGVDRAVAHTLAPQTILRELDAYQRDGVHIARVWNPLNRQLDLAGKRMDDLTAQLKPHLDYLLARSAQFPASITPGMDISRNGIRAVIPSVPTNMARENMQWTFERVFVMALNMGDEYNREAIRRGYNLEQSQIDNLLLALDDKDWDTVVAIRDIVSSLWPELESAYESMNLVKPVKTTGSDYATLTGKVVKGGYYPVKFDSTLSRKVDANVKVDDMMSSIVAAFRGAKTPDGATKARQGTAGLPVSLSLQNLASHLSHVTKYAYAAPIISDIARVVNNPVYADTVTRAFGKDFYQQLMPALQRIAAGDAEKLMVATNRAFGSMRSMVTAGALSGRATVAIKQPLSYITFLRKFDAIKGLSGLADYYANWSENAKAAKELSFMMRHRAELIDESLGDLLRIGQNATSASGKVRAVVEKIFYSPITLMDALVSFPIWHTAFVDGQKKGMTITEAATHADTWVAETNPSTRPQDRSWLLSQKTSVYAAFNLFAGWTHKHANEIQFNLSGYAKGKISTTDLLTFVVTDMLISPLLGSLMISALRGKQPADEPEALAVDLVSYNLAGIPIVGDVVTYGFRKATGQRGFMPGDSPMNMVIDTTVGTINELFNTEDEDYAKRVAWELAKGLSFMYKIPATRVYEDFMEGWRQYQDGGVATNLLFPNPERRNE